MPILSDFPSVETPIVDPKTGTASRYFRSWVTDPGQGNALGLNQAIAQSVGQAVPVPVLQNKNASIPTTAFPLGSFPGGLYRLSWYLQITVADGVASSVQLIFGWTSQGRALTASGSAVTGDSLTTFQTGQAPLIYTDAGAPITYATNYNSTTPNKMQHLLALIIEGPFV